MEILIWHPTHIITDCEHIKKMETLLDIPLQGLYFFAQSKDDGKYFGYVEHVTDTIGVAQIVKKVWLWMSDDDLRSL